MFAVELHRHAVQRGKPLQSLRGNDVVRVVVATVGMQHGDTPPVGVLELALKRQSYGIRPINEQVIAEQQRIADTFFELKLLPKPVKISDAIRKPGS